MFSLHVPSCLVSCCTPRRTGPDRFEDSAIRAPFRFVQRFLGVLACLAVGTFPAAGQDSPSSLLRLSGVYPTGVRASATEKWGAFTFTITNHGEGDRLARVVLFYAGQPSREYAREVHVPAHSTIASWLLVGPAPPQQSAVRREIEVRLYDRTGGANRLIPPPTEERIRSRWVSYRKSELFTTVMIDDDSFPPNLPGRLPRSDTPGEEAIVLVRTFRHAHHLSGVVPVIHPGDLPCSVEAFAGVDHLVIATGRIAEDPVGLRALRQWLERGGKVWVMLDQVEPDAIAPLLGEALDFRVIDRGSLTHFVIEPSSRYQLVRDKPQEHESPVPFVRVMLPDHERPLFVVKQTGESGPGWPAWFTRRVGRGTVLFTTLGPRGWVRPRGRGDPPSRYENFPAVPMPRQPFETFTDRLLRPPDDVPFPLESFEKPLAEEIGYTVASRNTVGAVFAVFVLATLALGLALRRTRRPELLGLLAPATALVAAAVFFLLGESSRRAVPATVAVGQIVDVSPGTAEAAVRGMLGVYRPEEGRLPLAAEEGGMLEWLEKGQDVANSRLVLTDMESWRLERFTLSGHPRFATFQSTLATPEPITAIARFGPEGLEGKLTAAPFRNVGDALLSTPADRRLAINLDSGGRFRTTGKDVLTNDEFLAGNLVSDRQRRRQELYRQFLRRPKTGRVAPQTVLLAWADPLSPFTLPGEARTVGNALLAVPLQLERPRSGATITIPAPLVSYRRIKDGLPVRPTREGGNALDMHVRFQIPGAVLPLTVERARLTARIDCPGRRVTLSGQIKDKFTAVHRVESPLDPIRVEITDKEMLRLDDEGGLHVNVAISDLLAGGKSAGSDKWTIHYLEAEIAGRADPQTR
jgi:hypothetical protein